MHRTRARTYTHTHTEREREREREGYGMANKAHVSEILQLPYGHSQHVHVSYQAGF